MLNFAARSADVLALVLRQGLVSVTAGLIAGIAGALGLTRLLESPLYEVSATDPLIFVSVPLGPITGYLDPRATCHSRGPVGCASSRIVPITEEVNGKRNRNEHSGAIKREEKKLEVQLRKVQHQLDGVRSAAKALGYTAAVEVKGAKKCPGSSESRSYRSPD